MIISNEEKLVLQKHYAERIKSLAANLKDIISRDDQDVLDDTIMKIEYATGRIVTIQHQWACDHPLEEQKMEPENE